MTIAFMKMLAWFPLVKNGQNIGIFYILVNYCKQNHREKKCNKEKLNFRGGGEELECAMLLSNCSNVFLMHNQESQQ